MALVQDRPVGPVGSGRDRLLRVRIDLIWVRDWVSLLEKRNRSHYIAPWDVSEMPEA